MKNKMRKAIGVMMFYAFVFVFKTNAQTILMQETFTGNVLPAGWTQDSAGFAPVIPAWKFTGLPNNITGLGFDSDYIRIYKSGEYSLYTNSFSSIGLNNLFLSYSEFYISTSPSQGFMRIEVSSDSGTTWNIADNNLIYAHGAPSNSVGSRKVIDLSSLAINKPKVMIRFRGLLPRWAIDSVVVSDSAFCTMPTDTGGVVISNRDYACTGSLVNLHLESLSRGIGQTYQWQVSNAANGNVLTDIPGATADTLVYPQNGLSTYMCKVTCLTAAAGTSKPLTLGDTVTTPGTIASLHSLGLCSTNDTLYLVAPKTDPALTYQWAWADSVYNTYYDIPGATDTLLAANIATFPTEKYIKCKQVCANSGRYNISDYYPEFINYNPDCYCLGYSLNTCPPSINFFSGGIINVALQGTTLNNSSATCNNLFGYSSAKFNYTYFPPTGSATATLAPGGVYTFSCTIDTLGEHDVAFWIDYNHNGTFEVNEYKAVAFPATPGIAATSTFTVPFNAALGQTAMRVRSALNFPTLTANGSCASYFGGETEDYVITIDTATAVTEMIQGSIGLYVYPNPSNKGSTVTLTVNAAITKEKTVQIITPQGTLVYTATFNGNRLVLENKLAAGIYAVKVTVNGEGSATRKLIVVR